MKNVVEISSVDMHTGGEPVRIVTAGYPEISGDTILAKRRYVHENLDHLRQFLMLEPRGHYDMYGVILVEPDLDEADMAVLFMHNEGYSTMCGHAVIALGRYAVDREIVETRNPETAVNIQCPCGLVTAYVERDNGGGSRVRFESVPAFGFALDKIVETNDYGPVTVDIGYGGAFYAFVAADQFGLDVRQSRVRDLVDAATAVTEAVKCQVSLHHPDDNDLAFLYGTILTDGRDAYSSDPTANACVFADAQVDRSPTGSGVTARIALQHRRGLIQLGRERIFESVVGSRFTGRAVSETRCGDFRAVTVEVAGVAHYTGESTFRLEDGDDLGRGFIVR
ncbi:MAG: Trans-3-hydroxy-L-proline dehydratase [Alphaproteobacteria bacterium MarineAlpha3_Bin4]|mgnify:FL=1|nr:proline racemase family protein [Pseudomonadota bacterium]PPR76412.1 MAG: Trans-3-hydroxy-L-proline dehydratase [Alphaproteobacteria bacterium MarineAlpha3_Bin4]